MARSYPSWIAGVGYIGPDGTDRQTFCGALRPGDLLTLVPEPTNPHDPKAVAIYSTGHHLGYVPARHHWVHDSLSEGDELECVVTDVDCPNPGRAEHVHIRISVLADGDRTPAGGAVPNQRRRASRIAIVLATALLFVSIIVLALKPEGASSGRLAETPLPRPVGRGVAGRGGPL